MLAKHYGRSPKINWKNEFNPDSEYVENAVDKYLQEGGKITKIDDISGFNIENSYYHLDFDGFGGVAE
jgi:hypothetical protein